MHFLSLVVPHTHTACAATQVLLVLILYVYSILGLMFMGKNDPVHFGSLGTASLGSHDEGTDSRPRYDC